jgi:hypothetical protein
VGSARGRGTEPGQFFTQTPGLAAAAKWLGGIAPQRKALVHVHCHHKSVVGQEDEFELLKKMGVEVREPEKGCCGLAGSFGFEAGHDHVSMAIGDQRLLPAVRNTGRDEWLIANGFSCQTQIEQGAGREPQHLAQMIAAGLGVRRAASAPKRRTSSGMWTAALVGGGAVLAGELAYKFLTRPTEANREREVTG